MAVIDAPPRSAREVLACADFFSSLPPQALDQIAPLLQLTRVPAGAVVVWEGEPGDRYYLIATGTAEVWAAKAKPGPRPSDPWTPDSHRFQRVGVLNPGNGFGEMALLLGGARHATVVASTDLVLYSIDQPAFQRVLEEYRGLAVALEEEMTLRSLATSAGRTSPFAHLDPEQLRWLAGRLEKHTYQPGTDIVRQGEPGDALYIIETGRAEVIARHEDGAEYQLVVLGPGQPFGEQALLSAEPRSATVRALQPVTALRLGREDFERVLREHPDRSQYFQQLSIQRQRPRRCDACVLEQQDGDGKPSFILKDRVRGRYFKVSEEGAFLWDLMDGEHTVRDLAVAYFNRYGAIGLDAVIDIMVQLDEAGFITIQHVHQGHGSIPQPRNQPLRRTLARLLPYLTRSISFPWVDPFLARLYRYGFRWLYWIPVQVLFTLAILVGGGIFLAYLHHGGVEVAEGAGSTVIIIAATVVGVALHLSLHEIAHALTTKHYGREVRHAGIGWYLFIPIIFVDVSDMWLARKWPRIAVSVAGPFTNFLLSGLAMIALPLIHNLFIQSILFEFAAAGYVLGLINLNPLLEFDGYYAFSDWLEVPNLRKKALAFIGSVLRRLPPTTRDTRLRLIFAWYGSATLLYTLFVAVSILRGYQVTIQGVVTHVLPALAAGILGWLIAGGMCCLILRNAYTDVLGQRDEA